MPTIQYSAQSARLYLNMWFLGSTRVLNANGISIASAVFAGLTSVTDHATRSVTTGRIYSAAMRSNNNCSISRLLHWFSCFYHQTDDYECINSCCASPASDVSKTFESTFLVRSVQARYRGITW